MKPETIQSNLPPVIRVFLSSTFADMEKERSYFNEVLVPRLNRICAERGVSFFSVDLRWGITEEEQVNGQVLPICLSEIDKCRPFFIGILGNRYGSVMETVPPQIVDSIPWLLGHEGRSITELEMLYAVLEQEQDDSVKNCAFYLRSDELSAQWYGPSEETPRLTALKNRIRSDDRIPSTDYSDLEEFGRVVMADILQWLDQEFPVPEKVSEVRRAWYDRELLRGYIETPQLNRFLDSYFGESDRSLLFYGDGARGKTTFLTAWQPQEGRKILINCGSDDTFLYWPSIARQIINALGDINKDCGVPDIKASASMMFQLMQSVHDRETAGQAQRLSTDFYFVTDEDREDFRVEFLAWLEKLPLTEPVYIIINDLNLLEDESSHMLSWLPSSACGNIRFVCSTNSGEMVSNAENLGWNCKEMPGFPRESAEEYIRNYLRIYGKSLAAEQLQTLLQSPVTAFPGQLRFMVDFLIDNGRFENLSTLIRGLAVQTEPRGVYRYVYDFSVEHLTAREREAVATVFALLRCARMSLNEPECFRLTAAHTGVTAMEWARIRGIIEEFELIKGDYWNMRDEELQKFADSMLPGDEMAAIHELLGDDMLRQLHAPDQNRGSLRTIRESTAFAKAALSHYQCCKNWEKLHITLTDPGLLYYLSKLDWQAVRVAWVQLFLHTDIDISATLYTLLDRYRDGQGDSRQIAFYVAGLFLDLEQRTHLDRVYHIIGTDEIAGSLNKDLERISQTFANLYNSMHRLKISGQFRKLYSQVNQALSSAYRFSPIERCQLLFFKADCEGHLQLFREFLDTSNAYYEEAIRASSLYDMRRALSFRGDALYRLERYRDAAAVQRQVSRISLRDGDLRAYLASRNVLAMCLYRDGKYAQSIAEYDTLYRYWMKLEDIREAANVLMNKCNALAFSGDYKTALETARNAREWLPANQPRLAGIRVSLLSNMGAYALELQAYDQAESDLLQAIAEAEALEQDYTVVRSRNALIKVYEQTDRFMKAVEQYKLQMELLWNRREYGMLTEALRNATELLLSNKYAPMARELQAQWEARFSQMEGGREFFDKQVKASVSDSQRIVQKKEQLALARSEGDPAKTARACYDLACALLSADLDQALEMLLEAARLHRRAGDESECRNNLVEALIVLLDEGKPRNQALYERVLAQVTDSNIRNIMDLWLRIGGKQTAAATSEPQKFSLLNLFGKKDEKKAKEASVPEMLDELAAFGESYAHLVLRCLSDVIGQIIEKCTAQQIIRLVRALPEPEASDLTYQLDEAMLKNGQKDIDELTKDYQSPMAMEKLAYYEKCVEVLNELQSNNIAAVAGNLAIIYRRRKEQDKTLRYHNLSTEIYRKKGKIRDYLIELMNTATAYSQFDQREQAMSLLRRGMEEAAAAGEPRWEAAMAGNLASILSRSRNPAFREETLRCFAIEERYFRESGSQRDLVISLLNQILYLQDSNSPDGWQEKLEEAGNLIRANRFREFESALSQLEWQAKSAQAADESMTATQAEAILKQLLAAEDIYQMDSLKQEDGAYHALCTPKDPAQTETELLHLFLDPAAPSQVDAIFLCQPKLVQKDAASSVQQYVDWWNAQNVYRLRLHGADMVLQATCRIRAASWEDVTVRFGKLRKLWNADKSCLSMMCIGLTDLSMHQGLKLKLLNDDH